VKRRIDLKRAPGSREGLRRRHAKADRLRLMAAAEAICGVLAAALAAVGRMRSGQSGLVVLYHRIAEEGPTSNGILPTVAVADFELQLHLLRRRYKVVPLDELLSAAATRRRGDRVPIAITLDDDLGEHLQTAAPALESAHLPATFFLTGASLETPSPFWWQCLEAMLDRGQDVAATLNGTIDVPAGTAASTIAELIKQTRGARREQAIRILVRAGGSPSIPPLSLSQVQNLGRRFDIGFHTLRHEYLPALDDDALRHVLRKGRSELEEAVGRPLRAIAYPHGGIDQRTALEARAAGFTLGLTTEPHGIGNDPLLIGRVEPVCARTGRFGLALEAALWRR
jgi:peptidoglycan/xylan/chitin deacetylase (PgdA/CDA1 family)